MELEPRDPKARLVMGIIFGCVFIAFGILAILKGVQGEWSSTHISSKDPIFAIVFGAIFSWSGLQAMILGIAGDRLPNVVHASMLSIFLLLIGIPFIYIGITEPENIQGSFTIMSIEISASEKHTATVGGIVFILAGCFMVGMIPLVWRHYIRKGLMSRHDGKVTLNSKSAK